MNDFIPHMSLSRTLTYRGEDIYGPKGNVGLSVDRTDETIVFKVADTGCGIAPGDQQRVSERFQQVERARTGPDRETGLRLSIVRLAATARKPHVDL